MIEKFWFTLVEGPGSGTQFFLDKTLISIGRDKNSDISINDLEVSRKHAKLTLVDGNYFIDDNHSTNGTYVNDEKVVIPVRLLNGDIVKLGSQVQLKYESFVSDPDATVVSKQESPAEQPGEPERNSPPPIQSGAPQQVPGDRALPPMASAKPSQRHKLPGWLIIFLIILGFLVLLFLVMELGDLWCKGFLGSFFQWIRPGAC